MDIEKTLKSLTLEEKACLIVDGALWRTAGIPEKNIPILYMSDGSNGLRFWKNQKDQKPAERDFSTEFTDGSMDTDVGIAGTYEATCFPTGSALACSWDRKLAQEIGSAVANECKFHEVGMLFGPAMNTRRHPLDYRGFEYLAEDPCLAGEIAGNYVIGLQDNEVSGTLKHFVCNNQNFQRTAYDSIVEERALREIYLAAFERAVKIGNPGSIMVSYNKLNGVQACENPWLLTKVLREEWGYDGLIISDSSAVKDAVKAYNAGLDWIMPFSVAYQKQVCEAIKNGTMAEVTLDGHVRKVLEAVIKYSRHGKKIETVDYESHHALAQKAATKLAVLLKNDGILPINAENGMTIAIIGGVAENPVYQGSGCACVHAMEVDSTLAEIRKQCDGKSRIIYASGYDDEDVMSDSLKKEALDAASIADIAIVFVATRNPHEDDNFNKNDMKLVSSHDELVSEVAKINKNVVVVVDNNEAVELPWADDVSAILDMWYCGEGSGKATSDILFGVVNPSGKLAVTMPYRLEDTPGYLDFPGENFKTIYEEGIFVGYRYYEKRKIAPRFAFGHGLSYTEFEYSDIKLSSSKVKLGEDFFVSFKVKNVGKLAGEEVAQLYIHDGHSRLKRPEKELKNFEKLMLHPGEEQTITIALYARDFQYYDPLYGEGGWIADSGEFEILIGSSSDDIRIKAAVTIESEQKYVPQFRTDTHFMDILGNRTAREMFYDFMIGRGFLKPEQKCAFTDSVLISTFWGIAQYLDYMLPGKIEPSEVEDLMDRINKATH